jgi:hypothetical protein
MRLFISLSFSLLEIAQLRSELCVKESTKPIWERNSLTEIVAAELILGAPKAISRGKEAHP